MCGHASDFAPTYNKPSPVFANHTNNVKLNTDSVFSNDSNAAS